MRIIPRGIDLKGIGKAGPWKMIYGRRKTGKTFLVENFLNYDNFFFVNRDATVFDKKSMEKYNWQEFFKVFREIIKERKIVIDEFHRLPEEFLDYLHSIGVNGELILITSTLWLAKKLLKKGSPLIGLVSPIRMGLIDERDVLTSLSKELKERELIEASIYLREPFLIPSFKPPLREFLFSFLYENRFFMGELLGEIFTEEEKELTSIYEGVLKAIADGKNVSTEISSLLFSRGLLLKDNPGVMQKYLNILTQMGIIERYEVFGRKKFRYYHSSPVFDLHYYLEEKYSYSEIEIPSELVKKVVNIKIPFHAQWFFRSLLSKKFGLIPKIVEEKDYEIDIALFELKKLKLVGEVKWKEIIDKNEIKSVEEKFSKFNKVKKIMIVPDKKVLEKEPEDIEVWDTNEVLKLI